MNGSLIYIALFAQRNRLENLSDAFRPQTEAGSYDQLLTGLTVVVSVFAGIWLLTRLLAGRPRRGPYTSPRKLFRSLCKAHHLGWRERRLLGRLARSQRLDQPARLFLEPGRFDEKNLSPALRVEVVPLRKIRSQIFAEGTEREPMTPVAPTLVTAKPPKDRSPVVPNGSSSPARPAAPSAALPPAAVPVLDIPPWTSGIGTPTS